MADPLDYLGEDSPIKLSDKPSLPIGGVPGGTGLPQAAGPGAAPGASLLQSIASPGANQVTTTPTGAVGVPGGPVAINEDPSGGAPEWLRSALGVAGLVPKLSDFFKGLGLDDTFPRDEGAFQAQRAGERQDFTGFGGDTSGILGKDDLLTAAQAEFGETGAEAAGSLLGGLGESLGAVPVLGAASTAFDLANLFGSNQSDTRKILGGAHEIGSLVAGLFSGGLSFPATYLAGQLLLGQGGLADLIGGTGPYDNYAMTRRGEAQIAPEAFNRQMALLNLAATPEELTQALSGAFGGGQQALLDPATDYVRFAGSHLDTSEPESILNALYQQRKGMVNDPAQRDALVQSRQPYMDAIERLNAFIGSGDPGIVGLASALTTPQDYENAVFQRGDLTPEISEAAKLLGFDLDAASKRAAEQAWQVQLGTPSP